VPIVVPYVKQTWIDNNGANPVSAARMGVIEEGILDASQAPAVRVFHNANQATTSGVLLALAFNSERFDQAGGGASTQHDTVTNNSRLTCLYAGIYTIWGNVVWASSVSNAAGATVQIRLNGATIIANLGFVSNDQRNSTISTLYSLAVNDYVELCVTQNTGAGVNINSVANYSPEFAMVRVG
jgi:hypothetical protein